MKNVAHKIHMLNKIRPKVTQFVAMTIYKSMIIPLYDIGDILYNSAPKSILKKPNVLQNRAVRIVYRLPPRTNTSLFDVRTNILPLEQRRLLHLLQIARWLSETGLYKEQKIFFFLKKKREFREWCLLHYMPNFSSCHCHIKSMNSQKQASLTLHDY